MRRPGCSTPLPRARAGRRLSPATRRSRSTRRCGWCRRLDGSQVAAASVQPGAPGSPGGRAGRGGPACRRRTRASDSSRGLGVEIVFRGWRRPAIGALVTEVIGGRAVVRTTVSLDGSDAAGRSNGLTQRAAGVRLAGPDDVAGLHPAAVSRRFPSPGTPDAESTKCPYAEFADAALPWRYSPARTPAEAVRKLRPWLVLLVGTPDEVELGTTTTTVKPLGPHGPSARPVPPVGARAGVGRAGARARPLAPTPRQEHRVRRRPRPGVRRGSRRMGDLTRGAGRCCLPSPTGASTPGRTATSGPWPRGCVQATPMRRSAWPTCPTPG